MLMQSEVLYKTKNNTHEYITNFSSISVFHIVGN